MLVFDARAGLPAWFAFGQFQTPFPLPSLIQWSQSYTPSAACQWVSCLVPLESCRNGPTAVGLVACVYAMSAMQAMTRIAVKPYHQVFWRDRFADRTAAR